MAYEVIMEQANGFSGTGIENRKGDPNNNNSHV